MTLFITLVGAHLVLPVDLTFPYRRISKKKQLTSVIIWKRTLFQSPEVFFSKFPPRTHTPVVVFVSICKEYIWAKHSYFFDPHPQKKTKNFVRNRTFHEVRIYWIYFSFRPKTSQQPTRDANPRLFHPSQHLKESPPRWISTWVGMRCQVMAMEVWFGVLLGFLVGFQHHETPRTLASWSCRVGWIFKMGFLDVFFFWMDGFW